MPTKKIKKILIAEDDQPIAKALKLKLEHSGFAVDLVVNGDEAMSAISKNSYDVLLLDLMMPIKDGFTLLKELKEKKIKIPTMVLSNLSQEDDIKKTKALGAIDYIVKSDTPLVDIVAKIKKVLVV